MLLRSGLHIGKIDESFEATTAATTTKTTPIDVQVDLKTFINLESQKINHKLICDIAELSQIWERFSSRNEITMCSRRVVLLMDYNEREFVKRFLSLVFECVTSANLEQVIAVIVSTIKYGYYELVERAIEIYVTISRSTIDALTTPTGQEFYLNIALITRAIIHQRLLDEPSERDLIVIVVREHLRTCCIIRGKNNKSHIARCLFEVVSSASRFLHNHQTFTCIVMKKFLELFLENDFEFQQMIVGKWEIFTNTIASCILKPGLLQPCVVDIAKSIDLHTEMLPTREKRRVASALLEAIVSHHPMHDNEFDTMVRQLNDFIDKNTFSAS